MGHSRSSLKCPTSPPLYPCLSFKPKYWANLSLFQWRIQGRGPGGPPPLFLDQTKGVRSPKNFLEDPPPPPPYLRVWMTAPPPVCLSNRNIGQICLYSSGGSRGPGGPPPLFLDQTKAVRSEKNFLENGS